MNTHVLLILLQISITMVVAQEETKDLDVEDSDDLGRRHRKRKKHQNQNPCYGGYGRTFGQEHTYISAPVTNYFFSCGGPPLQAPIAQNPGHFHGQGLGIHGMFGQGLTGYGGFGQGQFAQGYPVYGNFQQRPFQNAAVSAAAALANYITRPKKTQKQINQFLRPLYNLF